jgi:hypothetical protein
MTHLYIATPTYDRQVTTEYQHSLFALQGRLFQLGVKCTLGTSQLPIDVARNQLASEALRGTFSHLLMIDSDMGYRPQLIEAMLKFDQPIVGAVYPSRVIDWDHVWNAARSCNDSKLFPSLACTYNSAAFVFNDQGGVETKCGFAKVREIGAGILLIRRDVLEKFRNKTSSANLDCFTPLALASGELLYEDLSFCRRWTEDHNGEIWANIVEPITHVGRVQFRGSFIDRMTRGAMP